MILSLANGSTINTKNNLIATDKKIKKDAKQTNTTLLYKGPSVLNGEPILVFATFESKNKKTGNMVQISILCDNITPTEAIKSGQDESICGNCPHRHYTGGACYVNVGHAPLSIYRA